jgi:hypothetical protein
MLIKDSFKLDPAIKSDWIKALRSNSYKQDIGQLRSVCGFCCLGVLCDVGGATAVDDECGSIISIVMGLVGVVISLMVSLMICRSICSVSFPI